MPHWIRFEHLGQTGFGTLEGDTITAFRGDMFVAPEPTAETVALTQVRVLTPCRPTKMIALWNNFRALGAKLGVSAPEDPLYLLKANSCFQDPNTTIVRPGSYAGRVVYEGELGIVIGRTCKDASEGEAENCIFGYTCVNDITAADLLNKDPNFPQWVRAKSFDGFGPFGPVIATDIRPETLWVRTILNGEERQRYPIADMVFPAATLVSRISHDMTLSPGDVICCGTSIGVGTMKEPVNTVEIEIEGIGRLSNTFASPSA
jgi:2-keto-4-pentenoate hydratase/2-oxohepta-3-ene-1,7-dioic acid hydratase in catechol pathway